MARILAIDYGIKRMGVAVTDKEQRIATPLQTIPAKDIFNFLKTYLKTEIVEKFVIGQPNRLNNTPTHATSLVNDFVIQLQKHFPNISVELIDERYTSKIAQQAMILANIPKQKRQNKAQLDTTSAVIILQTYLDRQYNLKR